MGIEPTSEELPPTVSPCAVRRRFSSPVRSADTRHRRPARKLSATTPGRHGGPARLNVTAAQTDERSLEPGVAVLCSQCVVSVGSCEAPPVLRGYGPRHAAVGKTCSPSKPVRPQIFDEYSIPFRRCFRPIPAYHQRSPEISPSRKQRGADRAVRPSGRIESRLEPTDAPPKPSSAHGAAPATSRPLRPDRAPRIR